MIIDFHTHTFPARVAERIIAQLTSNGNVPHYSDGSPEGLSASMQRAGIECAVNLPVMTRPDQVVHIHDGLLQNLPWFEEHGIITFGGMHPAFEAFREEILRLKEHGIKGIKLHPAYQQTDLDDPRYLKLIDAASEAGMITILHAGLDIGFPEHDYASVDHILTVLKEVRPEKLVLAHMGGWQNWDLVEKYLAGAPLWLDTAFSLGELGPAPDEMKPGTYHYNLTQEDFVRLVRKHGADHVLFGSDSPWADQTDYLGRLLDMPLTDVEKEAILGINAAKLLEL